MQVEGILKSNRRINNSEHISSDPKGGDLFLLIDEVKGNLDGGL